MKTSKTNTAPELPLQGVKVLDFSRVLAGPLCGQVLGDLGADVVKIEHPERGDDTRDWGSRVGHTGTVYFNSVNRNKRSLVLDLKTPQGQETAQALIAQSDILVHNFKHGGMDKLGLGWEQMHALNPRLIYCSVLGYGSTGPEAERPGYDLLVQGEAGLMALNGEADQPPLKFGVAAVDMMTGMHAAQAVLAALYQRERTGLGRQIELSLWDCGLVLTSYYGLEALTQGRDPGRHGNSHPSVVPYGLFDAADGPLLIAVGNNAQFRRLCNEVIQRPDIAQDTRFISNIARAEHRPILLPMLRQEFGRFQRQALIQALSKVGIPCGEVLGLHEALCSERALDSQMVASLPHPVAGEVHVFAPAYRFDGVRLPVRHIPPELGAHTEQVLREFLGESSPGDKQP